MCTIHSHTDGSTFAGVLFRFMATCTYVLAKTCSPTEALPMFSVEAVSEQNDNASLLNVQKINIDIGINRVSLLKSQTGRVVVNGVWRKLPLTLSSGTVNIKSNPATIVLDSTFGLTVSFDKAGAVHVTLPSTYSDKVCGMCGNFNHLKEDDFHNPNAQNVTALVESWQTGKTASSCEAILLPHQCDPLEKAEYASELYCGGLFSTTGPFDDCLSVVQAESYFRSCVFGMCSTHGDPAVLCETLQIYSDVCSKAGIAVSMLRNSTFCPLQCGENSHYNSCADGCPKVCSTLDIAGSCGSCEARCECDSGFKLSGEKCVPEEDCGCWYNGKHYEKGETLVEGHCVQQCQCMGNNNMQCTKMQCGNNEVCKVKDGVKACFSFKSATCSVYGDPHYITYDRLAYDFQGGCSYILTTTCSGESSVQFTVFGHNMHPPLQNFTQSKLEAVALQVEDLHIILNQSGKVYVKYNHVQLPYSTSGTYGSVWVYVKNNYIILETTFGLRMQIDGKNRLFLQVDEHYKYELCGLCGTYSGYQDDDFVTPEGENLSEAFEFGDSWRVPNNSGCIAHPNDPRLCDTDEMDKASNECSALFGDAFIPCHEHIHPSIYLNSCVYDYCATSACNIDCNFDNNLCGWKQMITDAFDWTWQRGSTPTLMTGPSADHTGDGHYLYIEANSASYGDTARFISSVCSDPGPQCLQFWYHMYGSADTMGLHIYLLQNRTANQIWKKRNDQGNMWHLAQVDIEATTAFQIIIEGRRGSNDQSDVAIDDINLIRGHCSAPPSVPVQTTAAPQPPIVHTSFQPPITNITVAPTVEETTNLINKDNLTEAPDNRPPLHPACQLLCNFEQDLCQWNQMPTDAFDWTRQSGSTPTMNTGPSSDHTTGDGHYLYIEANSASYGDTARLISSVCSDPGPQCLQFWYHMYGSADTMGLHIYLLQNRTANQIWKKRNDQGNMWHLAQVDIEATTAFQIIIEGRRGSNDQSDVAIDDINLIRGHCSAPPSVPVQTTAAPQPPIVNASFQPPITNITVAPTVEETTNLINKDNLNEAPDNRPPLHPACQLLCNFEQDLCQWNQMPTDAFDWTRQSGSTPTMNTGPSSDHTTGDGHYLYIEANSASYGDTARFISSVCSDPGPQCLQFWYHMYGSADTMGLHIYLLRNGTANQIWKKRNDQGNMWHLAQVDIEATTAFQIIIEGRRGSNDQSDVAIDDINLIRGHCSAPPSVPVQTTAASQPPIVHTSFQPPITNITVAPTVEETTNLINKDNLTEAPDNRPPLHPACQLLCNFEQDLCQWNQMPTDAFDWTRQSGSTPTMNTGPSSDHTTGDGHYLYIEANSASYGDTARLISSVCSDPGPQCLQFWYHMYGSADTMGLHIYLLQNRTANQIWKKRNDQGNMWHLAQVDIEATTAFQIIIEGRRGSNDQSDVAIDDINLIRGHCSAPPSVPVQTTAAPQPPIVNASFQPPITNITVAPTVEETTNLINKDNLTEAPDNRPPLHPACQLLCNFEQDLCQWNQMPTDAFDWTRQSGSTPTMNTGPSSDHTTGDGHYLYIEANSASYGDTARFISSVCSDPGPQCLQFWYHMYGSADTMGLHIYLLQNRTANQIWKKRNDQGNMWHLAQVDIEATTAFQIIIEGRRGSNDQSDVAIDDINLIRGHCSAPPSVPVQTTAAPQPPIVNAYFQPPITNITVAPTVEETTNLINKDNLNEAPDNRPPLHPACQLLCNFEQDLCQWNQMPTDAFDWTRQSGSTPTMNTGPSSDHTTGDGHYLYIEANSASYGDTARFISSVCSDPGPQCLQFWYHMYGSADTMGLHIYLLRNGTANQIWKKRNDQGNMWHLAQVDIEATTAFQIIIEGRRGSNDQSDVAIDDINLIRGHCSAPPSVPVQTTAAPQPPIVHTSFQPPITNITVAPTVEETTNLISKDNLTEASDNRPPLHPVCQLLCNFEQDLCQWNQMPTDAFDWTRQSGSTPTMNTGPSSDHTTGDGHYLYIEANSASYGDTARFISSVCSDPGPQCLQFWYHMYGSADTMGLHIYLIQNRTANQIWKKRNDQGNMWHLAQVDIEAIEEFQIIFEGRRGSNDQSDVAIDDVMLHRGQCAALSCPQNSHYATCVPACSPTCLYLNGPPHCSNNEACVPGCVCDDGFVLKSQVCVPLQQCGCVDRNGTKHQFNEKWYTDHCSEQCECEEDDGIGKIDCDDKDKCGGNAVCLQNENGNYYCQSTGFDECTIKGEYRTFDKMKHDFEGEHSYVLVRTSNLPNNLPDIYIEGINTPALGDRDGQHESESSIEEDQSSRVGKDDEEDEDEDDDNSKKQNKHHRLQELKIRVYNHTVEFKKNRNLIVDGKRTDTPISVTGGLKIWERSSRIYLQTDFGLSVEFDRHSTAEIVLPRIYRRKVGGLCGNFDGQKKNDKMKPDGTMARSTREFGESWRV
ncbi:MAM and LDL-receptor class A domain-containing protein 1-like [Archocentrus centrarchus]|uniref:MAM and LDL-receptor class A domain-containing protein 1-like n=1 Tax=Archocentrus centrarchus TaxID=63155 RepID=UPI0011EA122D|nr:MAM and LDL-receptor class A domain-containing protein 1-like [Archocentrus centrarchus]